MVAALVKVGPDTKDVLATNLLQITWATLPSPSAQGSVEPSLMTIRLFKSLLQMPCTIKNFDSEQPWSLCPCCLHIRQYIVECTLGGKPSVLLPFSPSFSSRSLNLLAKSWILGNLTAVFSLTLDDFGTCSSLMELFLFPFNFHLGILSSSDDLDSLSS